MKRRRSSLHDDEMDTDDLSILDSIYNQHESLKSMLPTFTSNIFIQSHSEKDLVFPLSQAGKFRCINDLLF